VSPPHRPANHRRNPHLPSPDSGLGGRTFMLFLRVRRENREFRWGEKVRERKIRWKWIKMGLQPLYSKPMTQTHYNRPGSVSPGPMHTFWPSFISVFCTPLITDCTPPFVSFYSIFLPSCIFFSSHFFIVSSLKFTGLECIFIIHMFLFYLICSMGFRKCI